MKYALFSISVVPSKLQVYFQNNIRKNINITKHLRFYWLFKIVALYQKVLNPIMTDLFYSCLGDHLSKFGRRPVCLTSQFVYFVQFVDNQCIPKFLNILQQPQFNLVRFQTLLLNIKGKFYFDKIMIETRQYKTIKNRQSL